MTNNFYANFESPDVTQDEKEGGGEKRLFATVCARGMIRLKVGRARELGIYVTQMYKSCEINCALHLRVLVYYQLCGVIMRQYFYFYFQFCHLLLLSPFRVGILLSDNRLID